MRVLIAVRLFSGFRQSVRSRYWEPTGVPAIYKLIEGLRDNGHAVRLLLLNRNSMDGFPTGELAIDGLNIPTRILAVKSSSGWLRRASAVMAELTLSVHVWREARRHRSEVVYLDRSGLWQAGLLARFGCRPIVWRVLGVSPNLQEAAAGCRLNHRVMRWLMRSPFALTICTRDGSGGDIWLDRLLSPSTSRIVVLNGVDAGTKSGRGAAVREEFGIPEAATLVTFLGRIEGIKGTRLFIEGFLSATADESSLHALVIGDGEDRDWLERQIEEHGNGRVTHVPKIPHQNVPDVLVETDIYVSLNMMGNLSNANLEAIMAGCCIVMLEPDPRTGRDMDTALVLPDTAVARIAPDAEALAHALVLLARSAQERERMAKTTSAMATNLLSWQSRIEKEIAILCQIAEKQSELVFDFPSMPTVHSTSSTPPSD